MKRLIYSDKKIHGWDDLEKTIDYNTGETAYTVNKIIKKSNSHGMKIFLLSGVVVGLSYFLNKLYEKVDRLAEDLNQYRYDDSDKDFEYDFKDDDDLK